MNFLKKMFKILIKTLDIGAKYGIIILLGWVIANAAIFQDDYVKHYASANKAMERDLEAGRLASYLESEKSRHEHERQIIVANLIRSQEDWVLQCQHMREAYLEEKARRVQAKRDFYRSAQELYHLIRVLEYNYPEVYEEAVPDVLKKLPRELQDALRAPKPPEPNKAA